MLLIGTKIEETEEVTETGRGKGTVTGTDAEEITTQEAIMAGILIVIETGAGAVIITEDAHLYNTPMALRSRYERGEGRACERITSIQ